MQFRKIFWRKQRMQHRDKCLQQRGTGTSKHNIILINEQNDEITPLSFNEQTSV